MKESSEPIFQLGEIVTFLGGAFRQGIWIARLKEIHFEYPSIAPLYRKATIIEKEMFFNCGKYEKVLG